jgi:hypothetical protein
VSSIVAVDPVAAQVAVGRRRVVRIAPAPAPPTAVAAAAGGDAAALQLTGAPARHRPGSTGAGEDNGIDHDQNWLRFPYDSSFLRSPPASVAAPARHTPASSTLLTFPPSLLALAGRRRVGGAGAGGAHRGVVCRHHRRQGAAVLQRIVHQSSIGRCRLPLQHARSICVGSSTSAPTDHRAHSRQTAVESLTAAVFAPP